MDRFIGRKYFERVECYYSYVLTQLIDGNYLVAGGKSGNVYFSKSLRSVILSGQKHMGELDIIVLTPLHRRLTGIL